MENDKYIRKILQEYDQTKALRTQERNLKVRSNAFSHSPVVGRDDLRDNLQKILPKSMVPRNIGNISEVEWPFSYELQFDLSEGDNTVIPSNLFKSDKFQVSNEAGFLLTSMYRTFSSPTIAGFGAPLQVNLIDTQSSRRFNDKPIQIQHIGYQGRPLKLETPMLISPNSTFTAEISSWMAADMTIPNQNGKMSIVFQGSRIRLEDMNEVFKAIFY